MQARPETMRREHAIIGKVSKEAKQLLMDKELDMDMGEEMDTNLTDLTSTALYYIVGLWNIDDQHRNTNMNNKDNLVGQLDIIKNRGERIVF